MIGAARLAGWAFAGPALAVIALFFVIPVLAALALSLTDFDIYALADRDNLRFVGLGNYAQLLADPLFWKALGNTFYFVLVGVPPTLAFVLFLINPDHLGTLTGSPLGMQLIYAAVTMQILGTLIIRKMVKLEY